MKSKIEFTPIEEEKWKRREAFWYFSSMAPTGYSLTVDVDVTDLRKKLKQADLKFFPAYLYLTTRLLNEQEEFRLAKRDGKIGVYNYLTPLYAAFHDDDKTFSLMWTEYDDDFCSFYHDYIKNAELYGNHHGILSKPELPPPNAYTVSCVPWIEFKHFAVHSYTAVDYFFPSVEAGRIFTRMGREFLPLSMTCHHAAADGWHVKTFLERFQREADEFEKYF